jgi:hypothetical protein
MAKAFTNLELLEENKLELAVRAKLFRCFTHVHRQKTVYGVHFLLGNRCRGLAAPTSPGTVFPEFVFIAVQMTTH